MKLLTTAVAVWGIGFGWIGHSVADPTDPTQGPLEQAIGFYSRGKLTNAMNLPDQGDGFLKLFPSRNRGWSTFDLQAVIATAAAKLHEAHADSERIQVGDMSARQGGPIGRHGSHQNGLDVDLSFLRVNRREQNVNHNGFDETFVRNGRLTENFDVDRNWRLIQYLAGTNRVTRIFVDAVIKKAFCDYSKAIGEYHASTETLRILRVWPNHADHLHVRLSCPVNSPRCVPQDPPPPGDGCADVEMASYYKKKPRKPGSPFANIEPEIED